MNTIGVSIPNSWYSLWDFTHNPLNFMYYNDFEGTRTSLYGNYKTLNIHRPYDAESLLMVGALFETFYQLDEKTRLFAAIDFKNTYQYNQFRSIEKDFYTSYIAFTDTTMGDFQYNGPLIDFYFSKDFGSRVTWGLGINYGVERGIKDVFTQTASRELNSDLTTSLRFQTLSNLYVGGWVRRYHGRTSLEAVKEFQDAQVQTWLGYTVRKIESPGTSIEMEKNKDGYQVGFTLTYQHETIPFLAYLGFSKGTEENDARKGTKSVASDRGYWQRNSSEGEIWLNYGLGKSSWSLFGIIKSNEDWGKTGVYEALFLETEENHFLGGIALTSRLSRNIDVKSSARFGKISYDYVNYIMTEKRSRKEDEWRITLDIEVHPYPVTSYIGGINIEKVPLHYTWEIPSLYRYLAHAGFEYQWGFNRLCQSLVWGIEKAEELGKDNTLWQIQLSVKR
ncbi:MAG: hypothetical protein PHE86_04285 [Candidatus Marinimicrobia bacterium]|nr:hypothetical protein [Candidatus Neomarinimicrobiota bacterium]